MNCPTNHANRLEFEYDSQGRRISKDVYEWDSSQSLWTNAQSLSFVYDGWNLVSEVRSQGSEVSTNLFTWGLDLSGTPQGAGGVGGLLSVTVAGGDDPGTFFPCFDANGNITEYVDEDGTIAAHYEYDLYGGLISSTGSMADDFAFRFSTKYLDEELGWYYYGFRYYSSDLGRWPNRDPSREHAFYEYLGEVGFAVRIPKGKEAYRFVDNSPVHNWDILGLSCSTTIVDTRTVNTFCSGEYSTYQIAVGAVGDGLHCSCSCDLYETRFKDCYDVTITTYNQHCEFEDPNSNHPMILDRDYDGPETPGNVYPVRTRDAVNIKSDSGGVECARFTSGCSSACSSWASGACSP